MKFIASFYWENGRLSLFLRNNAENITAIMLDLDEEIRYIPGKTICQVGGR